MSIVEVIEALKQLDPENDAHWTEEGYPRLDVMSELLLGVTRELIRQAAPKFTRKNPEIPDYVAVLKAAEQTLKEAEQAAVEAQEAVKDAKAAVMKANEPFIVHPDKYQSERQMRKWLKGQEKTSLQRHERGKLVDQLVRDAGGAQAIGPHPIDVGLAARGKAARKARQQIPFKQNG